MNPDLPPPNRAIGWYRFMLWMMPTCIALTSVFGLGWLTSVIRANGQLMLIGWFAFNLLATLGIGFFEVNLRNTPKSWVFVAFNSRFTRPATPCSAGP